MISGIVFIIAACLCWGAIFVIPNYLTGFGALEITLGRYFFFGLVSLAALLAAKRHLFQRQYWHFWPKAIVYGFFSTIGCYTGVVYCIQYANSAVAALIFGMSPITIALCGNWIKKEYGFKGFAFPIALMLLGIILVNLDAFEIKGASLPSYCLGLLAGLLSLASWTGYTIANFHFMDKYIKSSPSEATLTNNDWVVMSGVATLFLVFVFACIFTDVSHFFTPSAELTTFLLGSLVQGTICTWLAFFFWNSGNLRLPIALAGQLSIFEMIFGLLLVYLCDQRWPLAFEFTGIFLMIFGVLAAFKTLKKFSPT